MSAESVKDCEHPENTLREIKLTGTLVDVVLELCDENVFGC